MPIFLLYSLVLNDSQIFNFWTFNFSGHSTPHWGGGAQFLKFVYNSTFYILSWFGGIIKLDCWLRGEGTNYKICVKFNILESILIFVPDIQLSALKNRQLGSSCPFFRGGQLGPGPNCPGPSCPGPSCPGPNCLGPNLPRTPISWGNSG